jgi:serine protease Do
MRTHRLPLAAASLLVLLMPLGVLAQPSIGLPSLAPLVDAVKSAVVNVDVEKQGGDAQSELMDRFFHGRRGGQREEAPLSPGTGSGFIVDPKGLVITNNHVVEGAVIIRVRLDDGRSFDAEVVGRDPLTDVAVVRLKGKFDALPSVKLGDSASLRVGDWVVAIGNPFGLAQSVSAGIISALDREIGASRYDQFLQTDAAINPGNSGGPLFNLKGEVIGMNTAIIGAATGIGFAVPSTLIKAVVPQLQTTGHVTRGWLGVSIQKVTGSVAKALGIPGGEGALVNGVTDGTPAQRAGLKEEDVIVSIDGEKVSSSVALLRVVAMKRPETTVALGVVRGGKPMEVKVKLGVRPDLENYGELEKKSSEGGDSRKRLGMSVQEVDPRMAEASGLPRQGAMVVEVLPGSPADQAGLQRGMVVVEVNRKPVRSRDELIAALKDLKAGTVALLKTATPGSNSRILIAVEVP